MTEVAFWSWGCGFFTGELTQNLDLLGDLISLIVFSPISGILIFISGLPFCVFFELVLKMLPFFYKLYSSSYLWDPWGIEWLESLRNYPKPHLEVALYRSWWEFILWPLNTHWCHQMCGFFIVNFDRRSLRLILKFILKFTLELTSIMLTWIFSPSKDFWRFATKNLQYLPYLVFHFWKWGILLLKF